MAKEVHAAKESTYYTIELRDPFICNNMFWHLSDPQYWYYNEKYGESGDHYNHTRFESICGECEDDEYDDESIGHFWSSDDAGYK